MPKSIRISDDLMNDIDSDAEIFGRSKNGQAEHYIRLGRAIERSPSFSYDKVKQVLAGQSRLDDLSGTEQECFVDELDVLMETPSKAEIDFFRRRKSFGLGVGRNSDGNLMYGANAVQSKTLND